MAAVSATRAVSLSKSNFSGSNAGSYGVMKYPRTAAKPSEVFSASEMPVFEKPSFQARHAGDATPGSHGQPEYICSRRELTAPPNTLLMAWTWAGARHWAVFSPLHSSAAGSEKKS